MRKSQMRYRTFFKFSIVICIIVMLILFLQFHGDKDTRDEDVVVKDNVHVITEDTEENELLLAVEPDILVFATNPGYSVGDVLVAGITDLTPEGFIRKVVAISEKDGQFIIQTEYGLLTDVFEELHMKKTFLLTETDVIEVTESNQSALRTGTEFNNLLCVNLPTRYLLPGESVVFSESGIEKDSDHQIYVEYKGMIDEYVEYEIEAGFSVWLEMNLDITDEIVKWDLLLNAESGGEIFIGSSASYKVDFDKTVIEIPLKTFCIYTATTPIPIVITTGASGTIKGETQVEAEMGMNFAIDSRITAGYQYDSTTQRFREIKERNYLGDGLELSMESSATGEVVAGMFVNLYAKLYGCTGAQISAGIEGKTTGTVRYGVSGGENMGLSH